MNYCEAKNPPVFAMEIEKWDTNTDANGTDMAVEIEQLYNNTLYNKALGEQVRGKILTGITVATEDWIDLSYEITDEAITEKSSVYIGYSFDSIPAAQKANIRGKTENGKLTLVAKKLPAQDIAIEELRILNLRQEG
ncbi:hypothetical protein [Clostridium sp. AM58-1XD]|uniref:hypothetical protein n=1 Tax=Clostridium sp. AM58-1XD TaxID=2292307 RepID=UPI000E4AC096|nr:hypothetical protein [Clostridium sp. AM58-1XD]RGY95371.1 hypothetical protein DXA13_19315 [Clostridium sp. AM58-1XD]